MESIDEPGTEQYLYRSVASSKRHRHRVSVYLVQRLRGSNVVARIEPLGLVYEHLGDRELGMMGLHRNLVVAGRWSSTPSAHHARVRVMPMAVTR